MSRTTELPDGVPGPAESAETRHAAFRPAPRPTPRLSRRGFLRRATAGSVLAALGGVGYAWRVEPIWPELVRRPMPIPRLDRAFDGLRLVQLSDLHVGPYVPLSYLHKVASETNALAPDVVVVTGDIVQHGQAEYNAAAAQLLARLKPKHDVLAVLGNHDWSAGGPGKGLDWWADRVAAALAISGTRVLRNEAKIVQRGSAGLAFVGLEDYWGNRFDPERAYAAVPAGMPCITLSHNPDSFIELLDRPTSWILSGHTHGGQVNIPCFGAPILPVKHKQFVAGPYRLGGKDLYVNRGIGWLRRIRFNARPEITEFTLTCA